jgi:DNA invertase Pin-like site-specific DNA recombinase
MDSTGKVYRLATVKRISDPRKQGKGRSLRTQADECHDFAAKRGDLVVHEIEWKGSSWALTQRDYKVLLDLAAAKKIDAVLLWKVDRFGRNNHLAGQACDELDHKYGVQIWSVMEGVNLPKRERDHLLQQAAQESIDKSERVYPNMRALVKDGYWPTRIPFGYESDKSQTDEDGEIIRGLIKPKPETAPVVQAMFKWVDDGKSVYSLGQWLDRECSQYAGQGWHIQTILHMLRSKAYIGLVEWDRRSNSKFRPRGAKDADVLLVAPGKHAAIIATDQFTRVQAILDAHPDRASRSPRTAEAGQQCTLRYLVTCGVCGGKMRFSPKYAETAMGGAVTRGATYRCQHAGHPGKSVDRVQGYVYEQLEQVVLPADALDLARIRLEAASAMPQVQVRQRLVREHEQLVQGVQRAGVKLAMGVMTDGEYRETLTVLRAEIERVSKELEETPETRDVGELYADAVRLAGQLGSMRDLIERALRLNNTHIIDTVAEVLAATIRTVRVSGGRDPVIMWQPWVYLLLPGQA